MKGEKTMPRDTTQTNSSFAEILGQLITPVPGDTQMGDQRPFPSWTETANFLEDLRALLLMTLDPEDAAHKLARALDTLKSQKPISSNDFLAQLPRMRKALHEDTEIALQSDPAVTAREEVILCYPGLKALVYYRIARALYHLEVPLLPRLITEIAHSITGIDIHPGAQIGRRFFIDHGTGVVIGATCIIRDDVKIYQGVTLGALSFPRSEEGSIIKGLERHPIIGDGVTIYSGATILGRVTIGSGSVIGGNVWVTKDVAPNSHVMQQRPKQDRFIHGAGI
jgi:serine O-acetyltransferase